METTLNPGLYYIVVDGYDEGNFRLTVNEGNLKNSDLDLGTSESDNELSSINNEFENQFLVYPNPSSDIFSLVMPSNEQYKFELFDLNGTVIFDAKFNGDIYNMDCSDYINGLYIIRVSANSKVYYKKIIINHW